MTQMVVDRSPNAVNREDTPEEAHTPPPRAPTDDSSSSGTQTKNQSQTTNMGNAFSNVQNPPMATMSESHHQRKTDLVADQEHTTSSHPSSSKQAANPKMQFSQDSHGQNSGDSSSSRTPGKAVADNTLPKSNAQEMAVRRDLEDVWNGLGWYFNRYKSLLQSNSTLQHELTVSQHREQRATDSYNRKCQEHAAELERLQKSHDEKYQQLQKMYAQSIKEMNSGVEPITDEYITRRFVNLRDRIGSWCRKSWGGPQKDSFQLSLEQAKFLQDRKICLLEEPGLHALNTAEILQGVTWCYIENRIFRDWLFGFQRKSDGEFSQLEDLIDDSASSSPHTNPREWRSYTLSRLQHSPKFVARRKSVIHNLSKVTDSRLKTFCEPRSKVSEQSRFEDLQSIMLSAADLAVELRTQKAEYCIDWSVHLRAIYNSEDMEDVSFDEENVELEGKKAVVRCILSMGWVKKEDGLSVRICKASVRAW